MISTVALILLLLAGCGGGDGSSTGSGATKVDVWENVRTTAAEAVALSRSQLPDFGWTLHSVSNTGESSTLVATTPPVLNNKDGEAGQWVVGYFRNQPNRKTVDGTEALAYPYFRVVVAKGEVRGTESNLLTEPGFPLVELPQTNLDALPATTAAASAEATTPWVQYSVAPLREGGRPTGWYFRYYNDDEDIVSSYRIRL